ncbi:MAG: SCO family protein [Piscinibacter sp.]|nr:SCO family protein [Piscinibacter sp.]
MSTDRRFGALAAGLATLACAGTAAAVVWHLTAGLTHFTSESWRRAAVEAAPRPLPAVALQDDAGRTLRLDELCGQVLIVDFIYTQCPTLCKALGASSSQLARRLGGPEPAAATVLSLSFDPERDTPARLRAFKRAMEGAPSDWRLARPVDHTDRQRLLDTFGVVAVPDGAGGFDHNAALHLVDRQCRLVQILDADAVDAAEAAARRLARTAGA